MTRVRFAPSPTGTLHIGGARTALFNWLYARHHKGAFLLRVEDTDRDRSTAASTDAILDAMDWLGMQPDEEAVFQSARVDTHIELANRLLEEGKAYRCYCTSEEVGAMREEALKTGRKNMYARRCRDRDDAPDLPFTVRFKMPTKGGTTVSDEVLGDITVDNAELDDLIILRSDGSPTYNFVVVCDDAHMNISHVIRGQDHMTNTFRQVQIYEALGHPRPKFAHLPLIDGLSKRKGSSSVQDYRAAGYVAEAIINYIARLGWSHGDQELFSVEELVKEFDLDGVNRGSGNYDDTKFKWVNHQWIMQLAADDVAARLIPYLATIGIETTVTPRLVRFVAALQPRSETMVDMAEMARWAFEAPSEYNDKAVKKWMKAGSKAAFAAFIEAYGALATYTEDSVMAAVNDVCEQFEVKMGKVAQPIRVAITGNSVSPPIFETLDAVGEVEATRRMRAALTLFAEPQ